MILRLRQPEPHPAPHDTALSRPNQATPSIAPKTTTSDTHPMVLHARVVTGRGGGPEKTILRSAKYAHPLHVRMVAAYIHPQNDPDTNALTAQADQHGCPILTIPETGPLDPRTVAALLRACRTLDARVWHGHDYKSNLLGLLISQVWPMKLVTTVHGWTRETRRTRLYTRVDEWCLPKYDQVVTVSKRLDDHCAALGVPEDRRTLIPNGIDPAEYTRRKTTPAAKQAHHIDPDTRAIGVVGRLSHEKGVDRALRALADIRNKHRDTQLHLIGSGPEEHNLKTLAENLGLAGAVRFWGWQPNTQPLFEALDLLLIPSRTEGLPNALLEAMAMGVPCAAADVGETRRVLDDGRCGLVLPDDEQAWAGPITNLMNDAPRRAEFAQRARQRVEQHFSFDHRMAKIGNIYDRVLGRTPRTTAVPTRRAA